MRTVTLVSVSSLLGTGVLIAGVGHRATGPGGAVPWGAAPLHAATVQRGSAAGVRACHISGWSTDPDPRGLNVRAGPSARARIVGRLPPPHRETANARFGATFDIIEARNGWFRIARASRWDAASAPANARLPSGWVHGRYVGFGLQTDKAFARPDPRSPVVATSWRWQSGRRDGTASFGFREPSDCRGEWVRIQATDKDGRTRPGWARGVCGTQETTCDGVVGDTIAHNRLPVSRRIPPDL